MKTQLGGIDLTGDGLTRIFFPAHAHFYTVEVRLNHARARNNIRFKHRFKVLNICCGPRSILMPNATLISTEGRNKN